MRNKKQLKNIEQNGISLSWIFLIIVKNLNLILVTPIIFCIITIIYVTFFAKPVYMSTTKIMSSGSGGGISEAAGLARQFGISLPSSEPKKNWIYPDMILNRDLAKVLLQRKFNTDRLGPEKSLLQIYTYGKEKPPPDKREITYLATDMLLSNIVHTEDLTTGIHTLSIKASEAGLAKDLVTAFIEELDSHQRNYNKSVTSKTRRFIDERIIAIREELEASEEVLREFTTRNRRIENSPLLLLEQQRLAREVTMLTGVYTSLKQQLETAKIEEVKDSDYVVVIEEPQAPINRIFPKKRKMVIISGVLGIVVGIFIGLLSDFIFAAIKDEKDDLKYGMKLLRNKISKTPTWDR